MSRFMLMFTLAAFVLERWEIAAWGPWFWAPAIALNAWNIGLFILERAFPRTWAELRREAGMYRSVIERWLLEKAVTWK